MKSKIIIVFFLWFARSEQVGICTANPAPSVAFDIQSGLMSQGLLMQRMTTLFRTNFSDPAESLLAFDTTGKAFYHDGTSINVWTELRKIDK